MKHPFLLIVALALVLTGIGSLISYHTVSVGLFMSPPAPSFSVFVPAPGFPLPVYATNGLAEYAPRKTIILWFNLPLNFLCGLILSALLWGAIRLIQGVLSKRKRFSQLRRG